MRTIDLKHNFKSNDSIYVDKEAFEYLYRVNLNVESIVLPNIGANIGEVYYIDPSKFPFPRNVLGPNAIYLIPNENIKFIYSFFQTKEFQKEIFVNVASSGQPKFNKTELKRITISLPKSKEQKCIGLYFQYLDNLITLHQRKIQLYNRFMTIVWEQRKLGELGSVSMCRRIFKEQTSERGDIPFYKIGTFGAVADAFISKELFEEYKLKYPYPKKGDILISASGSIGRTVEFTGKNEYFQDSNIVWLNHDERLSNTFLKCFYSVVKWTGIEGSTIKRLYNDNILNTVINLPSIHEQNKIGAYFAKIDNLITLHQWKWYFFDKKVGNAWEQRKAEELCSISTGKSNTQDQIDDGKYPFYIRSDIPVRSDKYLYDCEAVITIGDGNIGKVFHYVKGKFDLHQRCYKMTDFNGILGKYYYYFFSTNFYERAMRMTAKGTVDSVRLDMISKMDIKMPKKISEQKKIADCLTKLDNLITLHQWKWFVYGKIRGIVWIQRKSIKILVIQRKYTLLRVVIVFEWFIICCVCFENIQLRFIAVIEFKIFCIIVDEYVVLIVIECIYVIVVFEV